MTVSPSALRLSYNGHGPDVWTCYYAIIGLLCWKCVAYCPWSRVSYPNEIKHIVYSMHDVLSRQASNGTGSMHFDALFAADGSRSAIRESCTILEAEQCSGIVRSSGWVYFILSWKVITPSHFPIQDTSVLVRIKERCDSGLTIFFNVFHSLWCISDW